MSINLYRWDETDKATKARLMRRSGANIDHVIEAVTPIIEDVRLRGDEALIHYAQKFDGAVLESLKASAEDFERAEATLDKDLKAAIKRCAGNIRVFHEEQMHRVEKCWMVEIEPGVWAGEQVNPIESVGLYVPRGKGAFPSALYMLALPAVIAKVPNIVVVSPPTPEGECDEAMLYTAKLCGINHVYKAGGAQAIAALAYGTKTIPAVKKVLGPGSPYVAAAKRLLCDVMDPGMPAGPSEAIVLADGAADIHNTCLDILNEAEHGEDSAALLVTHDEALAIAVQERLPGYIEKLPEPHRSICTKVMGDYGGIVLTQNLEQSIEVTNKYAAEHVLLKVQNMQEILPQIKHAGEILIGENTAFSLGNYGTGVNHVLPTGGWAHTYSCTSVWDFLKRTSLSYVDEHGLAALTDSVTTITDYENFPAHGTAVRKRKSFADDFDL